MKCWWILGIFSVLLGGCDRSPYKGYKLIGDNVYLRLIALGEGNLLPTDSDSVRLNVRMGYKGLALGELFSTDDVFAVKDLRNGVFGPVLKRIHEGDSLSLIAPAPAWPWKVIASGSNETVPDTGLVQADIAVIALRTPALARAAKERLRRDDPFAYERRLSEVFRANSAEPFLRWGTSELFYAIHGTASDTARVMMGDQVMITYSGKRLEDGLVFDDSQRNGHPLGFTFGDKDQVINGLEVAVTLLRQGQEGQFIIPFEYAFGAKAIPNVLEPYTPVYYTVRLDKVQRSKSMPTRLRIP